MKKLMNFTFVFSTLISLALSGCNMPGRESAAAPTLNVTQAYETVNARLTQEAAQTPSATAPPTATPNQAVTPSLTSAAATKTLQPSPTSAVPASTCDIAAPGNPIDVTIPDDTRLQPGLPFTKVWRLKNIGTCTWTKAYSISLWSGEGMSAPASVAMPLDVVPGQEVDLSVDLEAPLQPGVYQGYWKLHNASGAWFGIGPDGGSPFWVKIVVAGDVTGTPGTPTATPTESVPIQASGTKILASGDALNLDNNQINSGSGEDIRYGLQDATPILAPNNGALFAVWGTGQPTYADCQSASLSAASMEVMNIGPNSYVCYRTDLGLTGWLVLTSLNPDNFTLTVQFLTWAAP